MQANTSIGEVVISLEDGREFLLRPSFYAINKIGSPEEIEQAIDGCVNSFSDKQDKGQRIDSYFAVRRVLRSCLGGTPEDDFDLFGYLEEDLTLSEGKISYSQSCILANHLIKWGVMGSPGSRAKAKQSSGKRELFDPQKYVGSAIAHLGLSKDDAWSLTMTEFQRAIEAKFPDDSEVKDQQNISQEDYDKLMEEHDEIMRKRAEQKKA